MWLTFILGRQAKTNLIVVDRNVFLWNSYEFINFTSNIFIWKCTVHFQSVRHVWKVMKSLLIFIKVSVPWLVKSLLAKVSPSRLINIIMHFRPSDKCCAIKVLFVCYWTATLTSTIRWLKVLWKAIKFM